MEPDSLDNLGILSDSFSLEDITDSIDLNILSLIDLRLIGNIEGLHYHLDPMTQFYNKCHGEDGKFCPTGGGNGGGVTGRASKTVGVVKKTASSVAKNITEGPTSSKGTNVLIKTLEGVSGKTALPDGDGTPSIHEGAAKRGKHGGSLVDPNAGTKTIDGIAGYNPKSGKPVPGSDAWLESHGISKAIFANRPYVKYEANKDDSALAEGYKDFPKADKFFRRTAEQEGQDGGYLMYKHEIPGSPWGKIAPQARPNAPIITNMAKHSYAKAVLENDKARLEIVKKTTTTAIKAERRTQLRQANLNLERVKNATPEKIRAEAVKNLTKAQLAVAKAKAKGDPVALLEAKKALVNEKRQHDKDLKTANNWRPDKMLYDAELRVKNAESRLKRVNEDPKGALAAEIKSQERTVVRSQNRFDKTAAKYVFPPGTSSARIDMNPDPQNVKNLTQGKGRIYFAMEGSIKNDAILTALKKEDPTAAVVNVPSVTLWQQKTGLSGGQAGGVASGEVMWFAGKYGKGREIVLIPDADGIVNPNVMMQAKALRTSLKYSGAGNVIIAAPPTKAGTKKVIDEFELPSGVHEKRKGIDDHLGAGRGTLSQLQYENTKKYPKYDLSEYGTKGLDTGDGPKINRSAVKRTEAALAAISGIAGPEGVSRIPKKMLAQTANLPITSALEARERLVKLGLISVEHIFDEQALSRGNRIRNPKVSNERVEELVRKGVIKEPRDQPFTEVSIEESPVVTILDKRFIIKHEDVDHGTLGDLPSWNPPKSYKGWTSPINGKSDTTGIAARQVEQATKSISKKATQVAAEKVLSPSEKILASRKAPPGRRVIRSKAGAKKYGLNIGDLIPIAAAGEIVSLTLDHPNQVVTSEEALIEFYNKCHGKGGRFCPTGGGSSSKGSNDGSGGSESKGVSGKFSPGSKGLTWASSKGRPINTVARSNGNHGSVEVDGIKAKAVYEVIANNGNKIRLYDKSGEVGSYKSALLNNHARMNEMYPLSPPRGIIVAKPGKGTPLGDRDVSIVNSNHPYTFINSNLLGLDTKVIRKGYLMPSSHDGNSKNMDYLLSHEYGHHVDFSRHVTGDTHTAHPLTKDPVFMAALSTYGKKSPVEAYAESFAEWNYSRGRTKNPAAIAMAKYEGWVGTGLKASVYSDLLDFTDRYLYPVSMVNTDLVHFNILSFGGGSIINEIISFNNEGATFPDDTEEDINADLPSFTDGVTVVNGFEHGSKVTGKEAEPSAADVNKATEIMREVMKDLGLDYDTYLADGEQ